MKARERLRNGSVEAVKLRQAAMAWVRAGDADDLNYADPGPSLRACQRANIKLLKAAIAYAKILDE